MNAVREFNEMSFQAGQNTALTLAGLMDPVNEVSFSKPEINQGMDFEGNAAMDLLFGAFLGPAASMAMNVAGNVADFSDEQAYYKGLALDAPAREVAQPNRVHMETRQAHSAQIQMTAFDLKGPQHGFTMKPAERPSATDGMGAVKPAWANGNAQQVTFRRMGMNGPQ